MSTPADTTEFVQEASLLQFAAARSAHAGSFFETLQATIDAAAASSPSVKQTQIARPSRRFFMTDQRQSSAPQLWSFDPKLSLRASFAVRARHARQTLAE